MKREDKARAQDMYINSDRTQTDICTEIGVTDKTLRSWIREGKWEEQRSLRKTRRTQLLQDAYNQLAAVNAAIKENGNVPRKEHYDAKNILRKEIEALSGTNIVQTIDAFEGFIAWLKLTNRGRHVPEFANLSMSYISYLQTQTISLEE